MNRRCRRDQDILAPARRREVELGELEREFKMPAGMLAAHRGSPDKTLTVTERGDATVGIALFDPFYPGCFPLRLVDASCTAAIVEDLLGRVPQGRPHLQLVIERDEPVACLLLDAGAKLLFELVHFSGELPRA